jgi:predicted SnoaL-like aldol condensation-catalyzing enzyme
MSGQIQDNENEKIVVLRLLDEGFSKGNLSVCDETISPHMLEHQRFDPPLPPGPAGTKVLITGLRRIFSDLNLTVEDIAVYGDKVWTRSKARGTNTGSVMGKPPTGKQMEIDVFDVCRVKDCKIIEHWGLPDLFGQMEQLGLRE